MRKLSMLTTSSMLAFCLALPAGAITLTNGSGDGDVSVNLNELGYIYDAQFNPIGSIGLGETVFESYVASTLGSAVVPFGADVSEEDAGLTDADILFQSSTQVRSRFTVNSLEFTLTQTVSDAVSGGTQTGSVLTQEFAIRNVSSQAAVSFDMYRYMDADLYLTDTSLADGGGVLQQGGQVLPYQTDLIGGQTAENTFIGITATGGNPVTSQRYSVTECCGLDLPLDNDVSGDTNGDNIVDQAYDVTLQLRNTFLIPAGQTRSYTTTTIWGSGEVPVPGSAESLPLLPDSTEIVNSVPVWTFNLPSVVVDTPVWIDPVIAVGYTYTVTGNTFAAVTAPSLAAVPDSDGLYTLTFDGMSVTLAAGETYTFGSPQSNFQITGIDVGLMLDPNDALAFSTGVWFSQTGSATVTQSPITFDTGGGTAPIPLPASSLLLLGALGILPAMRRKRKAA